MCTALTYHGSDFYFGRNLDLDKDYGEKVTVMPRGFIFPMKCTPTLKEHYALIGMSVIAEGYPLFFEATNEKGLSMAGLNFPDNAFYNEKKEDALNLAPYELIPYLLGKCSCLSQVRKEAEKLNIISLPFNKSFPLSPLHWIISDKNGSIAVESRKDGLKIFENPYGVLSNNPVFEKQMQNLISVHELPGDFSSESRFIRGAYLTEKTSPKKNEKESVSQFFRMLSLVSVPEGFIETDGKPHFTRYSCCCNTDKGIYYYNRCEDYQTQAVDMHKWNLNSDKLFTT